MKSRKIFVAFLVTLPVLMGFSNSRRVTEGNKLYLDKKYDDAIKEYEAALKGEREREAISFNLGNAYFGKSEYEKANGFYRKALEAKEDGMKLASYYSLGNCAFRLERYQDALKWYKKAIEENPKDLDAKYNYEVTLKKLESQKQHQEKEKKTSEKQDSQKQNKEEKDNEQGKKDQEKKTDSNQEKQEKKEGEQKEDQREEEKKEQQGGATGEDQKKEKDTVNSGTVEKRTGEGMKKEEAVQILNAVNDERKDLLLNFIRSKNVSSKPQEKDW